MKYILTFLVEAKCSEIIMLKRNNGPDWRSLSALKGPSDIEPNSISQVFVGRKTGRESPM